MSKFWEKVIFWLVMIFFCVIVIVFTNSISFAEIANCPCIADTFVKSNSQIPYGNYTYTLAGYDGKIFYEAYYKYDLSPLPPGLSISSVKFWYYMWWTPQLYRLPWAVYLIMENWDESMVWNTKPEYDNTSQFGLGIFAGGGWQHLDFAEQGIELVTSWVNGGDENHGFVVIEDCPIYPFIWQTLSRESAYGSYLEIEYELLPNENIQSMSMGKIKSIFN